MRLQARFPELQGVSDRGPGAPADQVYHHEDDGWWAESPDVERWTAAGDSYAEVAKLAEEGVRFALEREDDKSRRNRARANLRGQNGRVSRTRPRVIATTCAKRRKAKKRRKARRARLSGALIAERPAASRR